MNRFFVNASWYLALLLCSLALAGAAELQEIPRDQLMFYGLDPDQVTGPVQVIPPMQLSAEQEAQAHTRWQALFPPRSKGGGPVGDGAKRWIWLVDDFEDGNINGWDDGGGGCGIGIVSPGADSSSYAIGVFGACAHYIGAYLELGGSQPTGISIMVRPGSATAHDGYIVLGDSPITGNTVVFFFCDNLGRLVLMSQGYMYNCGTYTAGTWYQVDLVLDWPCRVMDIYINGSLKHSDAAFNSLTATTLRELHFYNYDSSSATYDEIFLSGPPASLLIFNDDFERGRTCHWSVTVP